MLLKWPHSTYSVDSVKHLCTTLKYYRYQFVEREKKQSENEKNEKPVTA